MKKQRSWRGWAAITKRGSSLIVAIVGKPAVDAREVAVPVIITEIMGAQTATRKPRRRRNASKVPVSPRHH